MPRLDPLKREDLPHLSQVFDLVESAMGFLPNSVLIMARKPGLAEAFAGLGAVIQGQTVLPSGLARMVAYITSRSAGCQYCQAHTHHGIAASGVENGKLAAIWQYETSPLFNEAERAALRVAQNAAQAPNAVSDDDFAALKSHFSDDEILEIVSVISFFGFLNRFNDTLATPLEPAPAAHGKAHLHDDGWTGQKHLTGG